MQTAVDAPGGPGYCLPAMCFRTIAVCLWALLAVTPLIAEVPPPHPGAEVLVLRNGQVVQGQITRLGDRYVVTFGETGEVRFSVGDVEFQCASLEEAYFRKRDILDTASTRQRLDLADWCLRHDLPHRAADQLLSAMAINPFDSRAHGIRRRMLHMAQAREISTQPDTAPEPTLDWQAIERALETMPLKTVEDYTTSVQVLLLNRCGTNACHGNQAISRFHLLRPLRDKALPRRLTQRNLYSTLQMIDVENPDQSPLLTTPLGPHGGEKSGMFEGRNERQWEQLRDWVRSVAYTPEAPDYVAPEPAGPSKIGLGAGVGSPQPSTAAMGHEEIHRSVFARQSSVQRDGEDYTPRDPFDPAIFNRRYFPEKSTPAMANAPEPAASKN